MQDNLAVWTLIYFTGQEKAETELVSPLFLLLSACCNGSSKLSNTALIWCNRDERVARTQNVARLKHNRDRKSEKSLSSGSQKEKENCWPPSAAHIRRIAHVMLQCVTLCACHKSLLVFVSGRA